MGFLLLENAQTHSLKMDHEQEGRYGQGEGKIAPRLDEIGGQRQTEHTERVGKVERNAHPGPVPFANVFRHWEGGSMQKGHKN